MRLFLPFVSLLAMATASPVHAAEPSVAPDSPALRAAEARLEAASKEVAELMAKEHGAAAGPARIELRVSRETAAEVGDPPIPSGARVEKRMIVLSPDDLSAGSRFPHAPPPHGIHGPIPDGLWPRSDLGEMELATVSVALGRYFGVSAGVLVTHAVPGSGLEDGDIITRIGGREVTKAERARKILESYGEDEPAPLTVTRNHAQTELSWRLPVDRDAKAH